MSLFGRLFWKKKEEDYETILSSLTLDIQKRRVKLSEIRLRERRSTLLVTLYTLAGWVAYVSLWYMGILPNKSEDARSRKVERAVKAAPVVVGPIIILFIRRIVQVWYKRKGDAEEKTLQALLKEQRTKVEEIKKKTNYYSTRDLIQRYDEPPPSPAIRPMPPPSTPQRPQPPPNMNLRQGTPCWPSPQSNLSPSPMVPPNPLHKQWYDKLADALLGDDDNAANSSSRYALICEKCFTHNGLVKESMWPDAQYICPKCNHFNRSANAKKTQRGRSPGTPPSPNLTTPSSRETTPPHEASPTPNGSPSDTVVDQPTSDTSMMEVDVDADDS